MNAAIAENYRLRITRVSLRMAATLTCLGLGCVAPTANLGRQEQGLDTPSVEYDDRALATVLRENVRDGLVDYKHLASHRKPLDEYLSMIARTGPTRDPNSFLTRQARLCYYINAYNAGVLAAVLHADVPDSMHDFRRGPLDQRHRLRVDGRYTTLAELRHQTTTLAEGDMRVAFALCDAAVGSPALHDQPFRPLGLEEVLRRLASRAMDNHHIVTVDHAKQRLMLSTMLTTRRDEFINYYKVQTGAADATMLNVVIYFASNVRRQWLNTAVGYPERTAPFERGLNRWTPPER
mgnify:CR=1 FL=1